MPERLARLRDIHLASLPRVEDGVRLGAEVGGAIVALLALPIAAA